MSSTVDLRGAPTTVASSDATTTDPAAAAAQVKVGNKYCEQAGLGERSHITRGDFQNLPGFKNGQLWEGIDYEGANWTSKFDAAYAIEATCHSPDKLRCFSEVTTHNGEADLAILTSARARGVRVRLVARGARVRVCARVCARVGGVLAGGREHQRVTSYGGIARAESLRNAERGSARSTRETSPLAPHASRHERSSRAPAASPKVARCLKKGGLYAGYEWCVLPDRGYNKVRRAEAYRARRVPRLFSRSIIRVTREIRIARSWSATRRPSVRSRPRRTRGRSDGGFRAGAADGSPLVTAAAPRRSLFRRSRSRARRLARLVSSPPSPPIVVTSAAAVVSLRAAAGRDASFAGRPEARRDQGGHRGRQRAADARDARRGRSRRRSSAPYDGYLLVVALAPTPDAPRHLDRSSRRSRRRASRSSTTTTRTRACTTRRRSRGTTRSTATRLPPAARSRARSRSRASA